MSAGHHPDPQPLITLFLSGDVMTGRGIDQVLPHPSDPRLYEPQVHSARTYVQLAEQVHGPIHAPVPFSYIWGDALAELNRQAPDLRLINLETSVTTSPDYWQNKAIHYRMHPANIPCLTAARIDYCSLANNHVLDWGYAGLAETVATLRNVNIKYAGAGRNLHEAARPAVMAVQGKGRVMVFAYGVETSGIPPAWAALADRPGVNLLPELSAETVRRVKENVGAVKQPGDIVVASIHWGSNWGYTIPPAQRKFAHALIDEAGIDIVHGHSSHHVKGIEVYKEKLILYGCGDLLTDYEGIGGHKAVRSDLALLYFVSVEPSRGTLVRLSMTPMQMQRFRLTRASDTDGLWLRDVLNRAGRPFGTRVEMGRENTLILHWQ
ncbi:MAG TPA: CapA family protein [Candidatus Binatia bacterium]|nr:CapA family protein [Candidatus Binatia bacterium]